MQRKDVNIMCISMRICCLVLVGTVTQPVSAASNCPEKSWIDARAALIIGAQFADIPDSWSGITARARIYEGNYSVVFFPVPSVPDAVTSVRLTMCGELIEKYR